MQIHTTQMNSGHDSELQQTWDITEVSGFV